MLFTEANSPFGEEFLRRIASHSKSSLVAVVTRKPGIFSPDYEIDAADVPGVAAQHGVQLIRPLSWVDVAAVLQGLAPDYFIVGNYQQFLPRRIREIPRRFPLNFHVSPLPKYAGLTPWRWMRYNGESEGGVVAALTTAVVDGGEIIDRVPVPIDPGWSEIQIRDAHFAAAYSLLDRLLDELPMLRVEDFQPQDLRYRTYYDRSGLVHCQCGILKDAPCPIASP